jgi:hypothetical protein
VNADACKRTFGLWAIRLDVNDGYASLCESLNVAPKLLLAHPKGVPFVYPKHHTIRIKLPGRMVQVPAVCRLTAGG